MESINDIANERNYLKTINDIDAFNKYSVKPEVREDGENEELAERIAQKLGETNKLPFLAVCYSGISSGTIDRHLTTAMEKGRAPTKLFMHLISREPLWQKYQRKKAEKREHEA
jgi:hypothetical protein